MFWLTRYFRQNEGIVTGNKIKQMAWFIPPASLNRNLYCYVEWTGSKLLELTAKHTSTFVLTILFFIGSEKRAPIGFIVRG
jgi:hypothetical protein